MQYSCFWTKELALPAPAPIPPFHTTQVLVVGGGFCGLSAALYLQQHGVTTTVVDVAELEHKASVRNAGMVCTGLGMGAAAAHEACGENFVPIWQMTQEGANMLWQLQEPQHPRAGSLLLAFTGDGEADLQQEWQVRQKFHLGGTLHTAGSCKLPLQARAALSNPDDFGINPATTLGKLEKQFLQAGGTLFTRCRVRHIERHDYKIYATTDHGEILADDCFVATGETSPRHLLPPTAAARLPVRVSVLAIKPYITSKALSLLEPGRLYDDNRFFFQYFWTTPDGYLVFGGRALAISTSDTTNFTRICRKVIANLHRIFPGLIAKESLFVWSGPILVTADDLPVVWEPDSFTPTYGLMGFSGHGLTCGMGMGKAMAERIMGNRSSPISYLLQRRRKRHQRMDILFSLARSRMIAGVVNWVLYRTL